jgi:hypothetical protein
VEGFYETLLGANWVRDSRYANGHSLVQATMPGGQIRYLCEDWNLVTYLLRIIAGGVWEPALAYQVLSLDKFGKEWFLDHHPELGEDTRRGFRAPEKSTIAEVFGISQVRTDQVGGFSLVSIEKDSRILQLLCCRDIPLVIHRSAVPATLAGVESVPSLIERFRREQAEALEAAGYGAFHPPGPWQEFKRVARKSFEAFGVEGRSRIFFGSPRRTIDIQSSNLSPDIEHRLERILRTCFSLFGLFAPADIPYQLHPEIRPFTVSPRSIPALSFETGPTARQRLYARVRIGEWLEAGGLDASRIESFLNPETPCPQNAWRIHHFVRRYKFSGFRFS